MQTTKTHDRIDTSNGRIVGTTNRVCSCGATMIVALCYGHRVFACTKCSHVVWPTPAMLRLEIDGTVRDDEAEREAAWESDAAEYRRQQRANSLVVRS